MALPPLVDLCRMEYIELENEFFACFCAYAQEWALEKSDKVKVTLLQINIKQICLLNMLFQQAHGRIRINANLILLDHDIQVMIWGGRAHIGAIALAGPKNEAQVVEAADHKDGEIALLIASELAKNLNGTVAVTAGIHYDRITPEEIEIVREKTGKIVHEIITYIKNL